MTGKEPDRPRPTMKDVAKIAGVHQTTVSLALRNHSSIPVETRRKIQAIAEKLGYRRDPLIEAFNWHRLSNHHLKDIPTIAYLRDNGIPPESHVQPLVLEGVMAAAQARAMTVNVFRFGRGDYTPSRLNKILISRGVSGVVLAACAVSTKHVELDWDRFSAVKIESWHAEPNLDVVSADQWQSARLALQHLRALGYKRIGLAASAEDEARLHQSFRTGLLVEQAAMPEANCVPPLVFPKDTSTLGPRLASWILEHRVDAVMSNWNNVAEKLRGMGLRVPGDVAVASLDLPCDHAGIAGVVQNHRVVGSLAVEQLSILLETHQRGVPALPAATFIGGFWRDGASAPPKAGQIRHV